MAEKKMSREDEINHAIATIVGLLIFIGGGIMLLLRKLDIVEFGNAWVVAGAILAFMCVVAQDNANDEDGDWADCLPP